VERIAQSSLFLAAKVCESPIKYRDVIATCNCAQKLLLVPSEPQPEIIDFSTYRFVDLKEQLMENERLTLKELGFSIYKLVKDNAHKWLVFIIKEVFAMSADEPVI
jgi:hypothetical protein